MVPMRKDKTSGEGPPSKVDKAASGSAQKSLYREAGCGAVALYDDEATRLHAVYFGRMPEPRKETLTHQTRAEMEFTMEVCPGLRRAFICDGAEVNWRNAHSTEQYLAQKAFDLGQTCPETFYIVDFFHACEHLKSAADALYGEKSAKGALFFQDRKYWLQNFDGGVNQLIESLRYHMGRAKGQTKAKLREEINYFTNQSKRMDYAHYSRLNLPIGSGVVEAACKMLLTTRMKRSGMQWSQHGGQGMLTLRAWVKSNRFDTAFQDLIPPTQFEALAVMQRDPTHQLLRLVA